MSIYNLYSHTEYHFEYDQHEYILLIRLISFDPKVALDLIV